MASYFKEVVMQTRYWFRFVFFLIPTILVGGNACWGKTNPGAIPVNEDSVRDHVFPIQAAIALTSHFRMDRDSFDRQIPMLESGISMGQAEAFNHDAIAVQLNQRNSLGREASGIRI